MKLGFLIERNVYFRIFGSIIDSALANGHQVFCLHDYSQPKTGSKGYQFPDISQTPKFQNGQVISLDYKTENELIERVLQNNIQVVVSLDFPDKYKDVCNKLKNENIFWVALQNGFDTGSISGKNLAIPGRFFVYSKEWLNFFIGCSQADNVKSVGFWLNEQKTIVNKEEIKKKWGILENKKVVLLLPFPFGSSLKTFWTKYVYGTRFVSKQNDFKLSGAIKRFCDNNNAVLLVKCRKKDPAKRYLNKMANKVLYDESFYPSTTMECLTIADICFNFYSTAAIEAISMNVPNVCVAPEVKNWKDIQSLLWQAILEKEKDFFDFPGVSYLKTIPEIINNLANQTFADFPFIREKQNQYMQKFAGSNNNGSAEKIIFEIEKLAN